MTNIDWFLVLGSWLLALGSWLLALGSLGPLRGSTYNATHINTNTMDGILFTAPPTQNCHVQMGNY